MFIHGGGVYFDILDYVLLSHCIFYVIVVLLTALSPETDVDYCVLLCNLEICMTFSLPYMSLSSYYRCVHAYGHSADADDGCRPKMMVVK